MTGNASLALKRRVRCALLSPASAALARLAVGLAIFVAAPSSSNALDRVTLRRAGYSGRITVNGTVEDYSGEQIRIRSSQGDEVRAWPASDVAAVETVHTEEHDRAASALEDNRVDDAIADFDVALRKEPRAWVRREILAQLVGCYLRRGDYAQAGSRFVQITKSDPSTRHFGLIPLAWVPEPLSGANRSAALVWLADGDEVARLIASSLLLEDPDVGGAARAALRELATSTNRRVQVLAQFQAWRKDLAASPVGEIQIVHWQRRVDALPADLRAGPCFLLARAYASRHDYELAAATWLWLPIVDDHDFRLAARACLEAGLALVKIGQQVEAQALFREVTRRFAGTSFADEAEALIAADARGEPPDEARSN